MNHYAVHLKLTQYCKSTLLNKRKERYIEGHYTLIKGLIHQYITIINIYAPNFRAPKYMKPTLIELKRKIDSSVIIVGDFNTKL